MVDNVQAGDESAAPAAPTPPKRTGHRAMDARDTVAELAARAHEISLEAGSKVGTAMKNVIGAAAGLTGFAVESARDLVQYMIRRGQMTPTEGEKLLREVEAAHAKRSPAKVATPPAKPASPATRPSAPKSESKPAAKADAKPAPKVAPKADPRTEAKAALKAEAASKPAIRKEKAPAVKKTAPPSKPAARKSSAKGAVTKAPATAKQAAAKHAPAAAKRKK